MINFSILLVSIFSSQLTYVLAKKTHWGSIRISAMTTLVFVLIMHLTSLPFAETLNAAFLGASFLGMSDPSLFCHRDLFMGSLIFTLIFIFILPYNIGLGGALGTAAFVSCLIIRLVRKAIPITRRNFSSFKKV